MKIEITERLHKASDWHSVKRDIQMKKEIIERLHKVADWDRVNRVIAAEVGCNPNCVNYYRVKHGKPRMRRGQHGISQRVINFVNSANWEKQDSELAREHDMTRERVRQLRRQFNKPASPRKGMILNRKPRMEPEYMQRLSEVKDWARYDREIAAETGAPVMAVGRFRAKNNIPRRVRGNTDWKNVDWSKRSCEIAKETGASITLVCLVRRRYAPETVKRRGKQDAE